MKDTDKKIPHKKQRSILSFGDKFNVRVISVNKMTGIKTGRVSVLEESPDIHAGTGGVFKGTCNGCGKSFLNLSAS
jgi:hypothetical protein